MDSKDIKENEELELIAEDADLQADESAEEVAEANDRDPANEDITGDDDEEEQSTDEAESSDPLDSSEDEPIADDPEISEEKGADEGTDKLDESDSIEKKREAFTTDLMPDEKEKSKDTFSGKAYAISALIFLLVIVTSAFWIIKSYRDFRLTPPTQSLTAIADGNLEANPLLPPEVKDMKKELGVIEYPSGILEKYKDLYALNNDTVGHLKINNTSIDTFVTRGKNNSYYLKSDFYGKYSGYGNAFLDYRAGTENLSTNSVIYGHNTETGLQVFHDLEKYLDYDFYINNPIIEYGTLYKDYKWKIFAVYVSSVASKDDNGYFFYYINPNIKADKFPGFIDQIKQYSRFYTELNLTEKDKILQLSTCVHENDMPGRRVNSRLVVAAKLMEDGESEALDPSLVLDRKDFRRPQVWYSRYGIKNPYAGQPNWKQ